MKIDNFEPKNLKKVNSLIDNRAKILYNKLSLFQKFKIVIKKILRTNYD